MSIKEILLHHSTLAMCLGLLQCWHVEQDNSFFYRQSKKKETEKRQQLSPNTSHPQCS